MLAFNAIKWRTVMRIVMPFVAAAALLLVAGPMPANATSMVCMQQYDEAIAGCEGDSSCMQVAEINLALCLQGLADTIDP